MENVGGVANQNLHSLEATDMIIIAPDRKDLLAQAERLAQAHREKDGLSVPCPYRSANLQWSFPPVHQMERLIAV